MSKEMMIHTELSDYEQVRKVAMDIVKSRLFGVDNAEQIITLGLISRAEGRPLVDGVQRYHIIKGKPAKKADAMLADFQLSGGIVRWLKYIDSEVAAEFKHPCSPEPVIVRWTDDDVKKAGLGGGMHSKYPRQMKKARVISEGVRLCYPAACGSMYTPEEVQDFEVVKPSRPKKKKPVHKPDPVQAEIIDIPAEPEPETGNQKVMELLELKATELGWTKAKLQIKIKQYNEDYQVLLEGMNNGTA